MKTPIRSKPTSKTSPAALHAAAAALLATAPTRDTFALFESAGAIEIQAARSTGMLGVAPAPRADAVDREADKIVREMRASARTFDTSTLSADEERVAYNAIQSSSLQDVLARRGLMDAGQLYQFCIQLRTYAGSIVRPRPSLEDVRTATALADRLESLT